MERSCLDRLFQSSRLETVAAVIFRSSRRRSTGRNLELLVCAMRSVEGGFPEGIVFIRYGSLAFIFTTSPYCGLPTWPWQRGSWLLENFQQALEQVSLCSCASPLPPEEPFSPPASASTNHAKTAWAHVSLRHSHHDALSRHLLFHPAGDLVAGQGVTSAIAPRESLLCRVLSLVSGNLLPPIPAL